MKNLQDLFLESLADMYYAEPAETHSNESAVSEAGEYAAR